MTMLLMALPVAHVASTHCIITSYSYTKVKIVIFATHHIVRLAAQDICTCLAIQYTQKFVVARYRNSIF